MSYQDAPTATHRHLPNVARQYLDNPGAALASVVVPSRADGTRPSPAALMSAVPSWVAESTDARVQRALAICLAHGGMIREACKARPCLAISDVVQECVAILLDDDDTLKDAEVIRRALHQFRDQEQHTPITVADSDDGSAPSIMDACVQALRSASGTESSRPTLLGSDLDSGVPFHASAIGLHTPGPQTLAARLMSLPRVQRLRVRSDAMELIGAPVHAFEDLDSLTSTAMDLLGAHVVHTLDDDNRQERSVQYRAHGNARGPTPEGRLHAIVHAAEARVRKSSEDAREYHGSTVTTRRKHAKRVARIDHKDSGTLDNVVRIGRVKHARTR